MPIRIQILLLPETMLSTLAGPLDLFSTAGIFWPLLMGKTPEPLFEVELVSDSEQAMNFAGGLTIQAHCDLERAGRADIVYVPSIMITPGGELPVSVDRASTWLRQQHQGGAMLCSACTGSFVLASTGLLTGLPATTHWAFADQFRQTFPDVSLKENAVLVVNNDQRLLSAGANASWQDLILYVIAKSSSDSVAEETKRMFLIDRHDANQGAYARCSLNVTTADSEIARAQTWLQCHLTEPQPVKSVAERAGIPSRTFKRQFKKHVGMPIIAYVQMLRVDAAKNLLLTTATSIDDIAHEVGYQDASYFRRIFGRETGVSPSQYRSMYRSP